METTTGSSSVPSLFGLKKAFKGSMNLDSIKWGQKWLQLTPEDWQTSWPNYSSDFWSAPKKVSLNNRERSLLNQALHCLMKNPQDWGGAHIIAWLYRRDYRQDKNGPALIRYLFHQLKLKHNLLNRVISVG